MNIANVINTAVDAYSHGDLNKAELLSRELLSNGSHDPVIYCLLALIASDIGEAGFAKRYACKSLEAASLHDGKNGHPVNILLKHVFAKGNEPETLSIHRAFGHQTFGHRETGKNETGENNSFLLIKAWGFGMFADVDHVLGQLLIAEMTGRTPVVHWGTNSLYKTGEKDNAFDVDWEFRSGACVSDVHSLVSV